MLCKDRAKSLHMPTDEQNETDLGSVMNIIRD